MMDIIAKARTFAIAAHSAIGQIRKYTGEPYIVHPVNVANIVMSVTHTDEMLAAALLHDVVEDTQVTIELITREFGTEVATMVEMLTDVSTPVDGNRAARKAIDREHIGIASPQTKTIKLADLIDNSRSICEHDVGFAKVYILEKELLLQVLKEGDKFLWDTANDIVQTQKKLLFPE